MSMMSPATRLTSATVLGNTDGGAGLVVFAAFDHRRAILDDYIARALSEAIGALPSELFGWYSSP